jgi:hypothetical protein
MSSPGGAYTNKELTIKTWPDFERLSWQGNGWDFCWCMHFQRPQTLPKNRWQHTRADRGLRNRFSRSSCGRSREWALQPTRSVEHFGGGEWQADDWGSQERKGLRSAPALYWKFAQDSSTETASCGWLNQPAWILPKSSYLSFENRGRSLSASYANSRVSSVV